MSKALMDDCIDGADLWAREFLTLIPEAPLSLH